MTPMTETKWLSTRDACEELGLTLRTLYRLIDEGRLVAYQFGRVYRLKQSDIDTFVEAARIKPGSLAHLYPEPRGDNARVEDGESAEA